MDEENREGLSLGEVFRTVKRRIWYILGAAVLLAATAVLLLKFLINPLLATYSMEFRLTFPTGESAYPDGSPFFYQDIVSAEFLADAKNSSAEFSDIDPEKMRKNGDISVEAEITERNGVAEYTGRYTVSVRGSCFRDGEQAEDFIVALANVPVERMRAAAEKVDYVSDRDVFESAPFEERILLLAQERENLLSVYDRWIERYSETYTVRIADGEGDPVTLRLKDFRDNVAALFGESVREELEHELEFGGYYDGDLEQYRARLLLEYEQNERELERIGEVLSGNTASSPAVLRSAALTDSSAAREEIDLSRRLAELINRNTRIACWIGIGESGDAAETQDASGGTLQRENVELFSARLSAEFTKLNDEARRLTGVIASIYESGMSVRFDAQRASLSGDIGTAVAAVGCFAGGFVLSTIIAYAAESNANKKRKRESDAPASA